MDFGQKIFFVKLIYLVSRVFQSGLFQIFRPTTVKTMSKYKYRIKEVSFLINIFFCKSIYYYLIVVVFCNTLTITRSIACDAVSLVLATIYKSSIEIGPNILQSVMY